MQQTIKLKLLVSAIMSFSSCLIMTTPALAANDIDNSELAEADLAQTDSVENQSTAILKSGEMPISVEKLVQLTVKRNAQILYTNLQKKIASTQVSFEQGVYEPEFFSSINYADTHVKTTADDRLSSSFRANEETFDDSTIDLSTGIKAAFATGLEVVFSYEGQKKSNNFIELDPQSDSDSEVTSSLKLQLTQPLLRGMGSIQAESKIAKAQLKQKIATIQLEQQLLKTSFESISAYWKLYKAEQFLEVRQNALENAQKSIEDIRLRIGSGREPKASIYEAKSNMATRKAAVRAATQAVKQAQKDLKTLLNISDQEYQTLRFATVDEPRLSQVFLSSSFEDYYQWVLKHWPSYLITQQNLLIQKLEIDVAKDEARPKLDLSIGYTTNALENKTGEAVQNAFSTEYPTWFMGLNFSINLYGNERAKSKALMAKTKQTQQKIDLEAVKVGLANDLSLKLEKVNSAFEEYKLYQESVDMLEQVLSSERKNFELGKSRISDVFEREDRLNVERQKLIDSHVKLELAKVALMLADGSLLNKYNVELIGSRDQDMGQRPVLEKH